MLAKKKSWDVQHFFTVESEIYKGHSPAPLSCSHGTHVPPLLLM